MLTLSGAPAATSHLDDCIMYISTVWEVLLADVRWFLTSRGTYICIKHARIFIQGMFTPPGAPSPTSGLDYYVLSIILEVIVAIVR